MQIQFKSTIHEPLATGEYRATLQEVKQADGQYGTQICFIFKLDGDDRRLTAYARSTESLSGKLAKWVQALLGRPVKEGETIDLAQLIGKPCILVVLRATKPDGTAFNRVEDVLPAPPPDDLFES